MTRLRVVTLAGDADTETRVATELAARSDAEVVFRCVDRVELLAAIRGAAPDLLVAAGSPPWLDRQSCEEAARAGIPFVGLAGHELEAATLAALGILVLDAGADATRIIEAGSSTYAIPPAPVVAPRPADRRGRLVAVWGAKGSPGRSRVAVELAYALAAAEPATVLVDADLYGGDLAQLLGVVEELPTVVWASQTAAKGNLDEARMLVDLRRVGLRGPVLIPGIPRADLWPEVTDFAWGELLEVLQTSFASVVVDVGFCIEGSSDRYADPGVERNVVTRSTIAGAAAVVAVCRCDPLGLKNFLWGYARLAELVDAERVVVVANAVTRGDEPDVARLVHSHTGKRPIAYLPDEPGLMRRALMRGMALRDLAPGSDVCVAIDAVAATLGGRPRPRGVLARLAGKA